MVVALAYSLAVKVPVLRGGSRLVARLGRTPQVQQEAPRELYAYGYIGPVKNPANRPRCPLCDCRDVQTEDGVSWCDCVNHIDCHWGNRRI